MSADRIMEEVSAEAGWDVRSQLHLALQYIDNQASPDAFRDFLQQQADAESSSSES